MNNWGVQLRQSIVNGNIKAFHEAILQGAQIDGVDEKGQSLLFLCCQHYPDCNNSQCYKNNEETDLIQTRKEMVKELIRNGAKLNVADSNGTTILNYCIQNKRTEFTDLLIAEGVNVCVPSNGATPLDLATSIEDIALVKTLLDSGADLTLTTALFKAIIKKNLKILAIFIEKGANVNFCSISGYTPLTRTILLPDEDKQVREEITKILLAAGAKPCISDGKERYPLIEAIRNRDLKLVELLLENQPEIDNIIINKALDQAVHIRNVNIIKRLVKKHLNLKDENSSSIIAKVVENQNHILLSYLINEQQFICEIKANIAKYSLMALLNYDLRTLRELTKVSINLGHTFEKLEELSKNDDNLKELLQNLRNIEKKYFLTNGADSLAG